MSDFIPCFSSVSIAAATSRVELSLTGDSAMYPTRSSSIIVMRGSTERM